MTTARHAGGGWGQVAEATSLRILPCGRRSEGAAEERAGLWEPAATARLEPADYLKIAARRTAQLSLLADAGGVA